MLAVVTISGKQYTVAPKSTIVVDSVEGAVGDTVVFDEVLLMSDKETKVGTPIVQGAKVTAKIIAQQRGEKINVRRFKAKVRSRKSIGFRPQQTKLEIVTIA